jgi:hypothetical protein
MPSSSFERFPTIKSFVINQRTWPTTIPEKTRAVPLATVLSEEFTASDMCHYKIMASGLYINPDLLATSLCGK